MLVDFQTFAVVVIVVLAVAVQKLADLAHKRAELGLTTAQTELGLTTAQTELGLTTAQTELGLTSAQS